MNKSLPIIIVLLIVAIVGFVLFFWNQGRLADQEAVLQEQMEFLLSEQEKMAEMQESIATRRQESDRLAREAMEARQMAEAQAEKERLEREKLVAELNARLKKEAEERRQAEAAQLELEEKMVALQEAQKEAQAAVAQLQTARAGGGTGTEEATLQEKVAEQQLMLASLEKENEQLKMRQETLTEQQIRTEEAILSAGGKVDIAYPEIRSPNVKRRQAIYFKERVAGHPPAGD